MPIHKEIREYNASQSAGDEEAELTSRVVVPVSQE